MIFAPKPLDALAMEASISLMDEADRWRLRTGPLRTQKTVAETFIERDDGLVVYQRDSLVSPWRMRAVALFGGDGRYIAKGRNARAILKAVDHWLAWYERTAPERLSRHLGPRVLRP